MKAVALAATVAFVASLAALATPAKACSCIPPDPWAFLRQSDGAFVGRLVSRTEQGSRAVLVFSVERAVKGEIGSRVEVETPISGAACGIETRVGARIGLFLERQGDAWYGTLCWQVAPAELVAAVALPAPTGTGQPALLVGGHFGPSRVIALDRDGRTLGYGLGPGTATHLSRCPGGRTLVEIAKTGSEGMLAIREQATMRLLRTRRLRMPRDFYPVRLVCEDAVGESVLIFEWSDVPGRARLVRVTGDGQYTLWSGSAQKSAPYAAFSGRKVYVTTGERATRLVTVDLLTGNVEAIGSMPPRTGALTANALGTRLAGISVSPRASEMRVVLVDLTRRPVAIRTAKLGSTIDQPHNILWLGDGRFAVLPIAPFDGIRIYDRTLKLRQRIRGWDAHSAARVGMSLFGIRNDGRLTRVSLPTGSIHTVRRLPGSASEVIAVR